MSFQYWDLKYDATQHNTTQHNTTLHNTTKHNTTQHNTTQHNTTRHDTTQETIKISFTQNKKEYETAHPSSFAHHFCPQSEFSSCLTHTVLAA
jgi:hypothetical protein